MTRIPRRLAALLAAGALVFAQLAVSAFACPMESSARAAPAVHDAAADATAACSEMMNANLCERHCDYGSSSVGSSAPVVHAPDLAPLPWGIAPVASSHIPASHRVASLVVRAAAPPSPPPQPTPLRI